MKFTTTDELLKKSKMTERELLDHLVVCSQKYLDWLCVDKPHISIVADCTEFKEIMSITE